MPRQPDWTLIRLNGQLALAALSDGEINLGHPCIFGDSREDIIETLEAMLEAAQSQHESDTTPIDSTTKHQHTQAAEEAFDVIKTLGGSAATRDLMRRRPRLFQTTDEADRAILELCNSGRCRIEWIRPGPKGGPVKRRVIINEPQPRS